MTTIYLDIETIPSQQGWVKEYVSKEINPPATITKAETLDSWFKEKKPLEIEKALDKCGLNGATNHIVCIGVAIDDNMPFCFYAENIKDESKLLTDFYSWLHITSIPYETVFVGHNISGFDLKVIKQRSIILGITPLTKIPFTAKPWDMNPYDTMVQWDAKNYTKLELIANALGLNWSSDVDGSNIYSLWKDGFHDEIKKYCMEDVNITREVYKKMKEIC